MKNPARIGIAALGLAALAAGSSVIVAQSKPSVFKVGVVTALSGGNAQGGEWTKRGYGLWADTVNADGGILSKGGKRYKVELVYFDDQSSGATAAAACERMLTEQKIDFILGPYASSATRACGPIMDKYKVPMITGSAENPAIWADKYKYVFGTIPSVNLIGAAPLKLLFKANPKPKTIYIVGIDDPFAKAAAETYKALAEKEGLQVLGYDIVPEDADFVPVMTKAKAANADILAMGTQPEQAIAMVKAIKSVQLNAKAFVQHTGSGSADFTAALGKDAEHIMGATVWQPDIEVPFVNAGHWKTSKAWFADYQKAFNRPYAEYTEAGCTAAGIAFEAAIKAAGSEPGMDEAARTKLVEALEKVNIRTFYGPIRFETSGPNYHNVTKLESYPLQIQNGKAVIVGSKSPTRNRLKYPIPAWDKR
jgi:branched-chain amino acid transport system substrate-binding protein